jgi:ABC-type Na+ efflux pump permease subunit
MAVNKTKTEEYLEKQIEYLEKNIKDIKIENKKDIENVKIENKKDIINIKNENKEYIDNIKNENKEYIDNIKSENKEYIKKANSKSNLSLIFTLLFGIAGSIIIPLLNNKISLMEEDIAFALKKIINIGKYADNSINILSKNKIDTNDKNVLKKLSQNIKNEVEQTKGRLSKYEPEKDINVVTQKNNNGNGSIIFTNGVITTFDTCVIVDISGKDSITVAFSKALSAPLDSNSVTVTYTYDGNQIILHNGVNLYFDSTKKYLIVSKNFQTRENIKEYVKLSYENPQHSYEIYKSIFEK